MQKNYFNVTKSHDVGPQKNVFAETAVNRVPQGQLLQYQQEERLLSKSEAAAYLGIKISTLSAWITQGRAPRYTKLGSRVCFRREWLDELINANIVG